MDQSALTKKLPRTIDVMVVGILTVRITEAVSLPKPSLFFTVQRDVASLHS